MITHAIPLLGSESWIDRADAKSILLEPLLFVATGFFWLCALPFAAVAMLIVVVSQAIVALLSGRMVRPNPLILRKRSLTHLLHRRRSAPAAQA